MEFLKLVVLAGLSSTLCYGQSSDMINTVMMTTDNVNPTPTMMMNTVMMNTDMMNTDMMNTDNVSPTPPMLMSTDMMTNGNVEPTSSMSRTPPLPTVFMFDNTRSYRDLASYQEVYAGNDTVMSIYDETRRYRYDRFNVSNLCMYYELLAVMSIQVGMFINNGTIDALHAL